MKYSNPSIFGIIVGCINVFGFLCTTIYIIVVLIKLGYEDDDVPKDKVINSATSSLYYMLVFCLIALVTSGFLIRGIMKQSSLMMTPWIYIASSAIGIQIVRVLEHLSTALFSDGDRKFGTFLLSCIALCIQVVIFYPIYKLYKEMRDPSTAQEECTLNNQPPSYGEIENGR